MYLKWPVVIGSHFCVLFLKKIALLCIWYESSSFFWTDQTVCTVCAHPTGMYFPSNCCQFLWPPLSLWSTTGAWMSTSKGHQSSGWLFSMAQDTDVYMLLRESDLQYFVCSHVICIYSWLYHMIQMLIVGQKGALDVFLWEWKFGWRKSFKHINITVLMLLIDFSIIVLMLSTTHCESSIVQRLLTSVKAVLNMCWA